MFEETYSPLTKEDKKKLKYHWRDLKKKKQEIWEYDKELKNFVRVQ